MTYAPRHQAYAHQVEAEALLAAKPAFALFLDMGTGKTKVILDEFSRECGQEGFRDLLVIAPAGSYANWLTEIDEHLDPALRQRVIIAVWKSGRASAIAEVRRLLAEAERPRVFLVNVEALSVASTGAREACQLFLKAGRATCVIDESTTIKSHKAKRTKFITRVLAPMARQRRILSGLPSPNSPLDLYTQFEYLNSRILGFPSYYAFRARYADLERVYFGGRVPTEVVRGYRDLDRLQAQIAPFSYRKTKDECLDLPPKVFMPPRVVDLTEEQHRVYRELRDKSTVELEQEGGHVTAALVITKMLRLHQVLCGHVVNEAGEVKAVPSRREEALLEALEEHSGKAVVWVNFNHSVASVSAALAKTHGEASVAKFWGGNMATRLEEEKRWKTSPACRFLVASLGAGSLGNTWVEASLAVYFSNDFSLEHRLQSEDRLHRSGLRHTVAYLDLMVPGTVDEKIVKALRKKMDLASVITGDDFREWLA